MILTDKAVLITGARRIGAVVATALAMRGMDVALAYHRSRDEAEAVATRIRASGRRAVTLHADLSNGVACAELVTRAAASLGRLDVLVNMASVYVQSSLDATDADTWASVMDVDLRASFLCARAAVPHMRAAGGGRIVNCADWIAASGRPRYPGYLAYYVAKKGVIGLTEALALELAADNILVNVVAPGPILAPEGSTPKHLAAVEAATPLGRWGGEMEIAIRVDGGRHVR